MPPITRSGRRGRRGGATNEPPRVQAQVEAAQEELIMPAVQQNVQAVIAPPPAVLVYATPNVNQVFEYFKLCTLRFFAFAYTRTKSLGRNGTLAQNKIVTNDRNSQHMVVHFKLNAC